MMNADHAAFFVALDNAESLEEFLRIVSARLWPAPDVIVKPRQFQPSRDPAQRDSIALALGQYMAQQTHTTFAYQQQLAARQARMGQGPVNGFLGALGGSY